MATPLNINTPAKGVSYFTPAQNPPAGTALDPQPDGKSIPTLFQPIKIRGVEFHNRIFLSPLCQYSAEDGKLTDWHKAHLGGIFTRGPGLSILEATAITPEGRITPQDSGLWSSDQIPPLLSIVQLAHSQNQKIGIQLSHAGRKASTSAPWLNRGHGRGEVSSSEVGGWPDDVWAPSPIPLSDTYPTPKELDKEGIRRIVKAFGEAAKRAVDGAGFDVVEIHCAHGYLLHEFLSPVSNSRTDEYGGCFENRIRIVLEVVDEVRRCVGEGVPLFVRLSATDWLEESLPDQLSWRTEDAVKLSPILHAHGVDFLDVVTGGNHPLQKIKLGDPAYQAPFAHAIKKSLSSTSSSTSSTSTSEGPSTPQRQPLLIGTVGAITDGHIAQGILDKGQADVISVGRNFIRNPGTVWAFAEDLGVQITLANQIGWGFGAGSHVVEWGSKEKEKETANARE